MGRSEKTNSSREPRPRYWAVPKVQMCIKLDKDLHARGKAAAKARKIPFVRLIEQGLEMAITDG